MTSIFNFLQRCLKIYVIVLVKTNAKEKVLHSQIFWLYRQVSNVKNVMLPLTGALIGTAVGGPLGLMVGYKVGAAAAFGGGAVGFIGARVFKRRAKAQNDADMERVKEEQAALEESLSSTR